MWVHQHTISTYKHCIALNYITLHYVTLHCITLPIYESSNIALLPIEKFGCAWNGCIMIYTIVYPCIPQESQFFSRETMGLSSCSPWNCHFVYPIFRQTQIHESLVKSLVKSLYSVVKQPFLMVTLHKKWGNEAEKTTSWPRNLSLHTGHAARPWRSGTRPGVYTGAYILHRYLDI